MKSTPRLPSRTILVPIVMIVMIALFSAGVAGGAQPGRYAVRSGDSLSLIARRCGVSVQDLTAANSLRNDLIHPGQGLIVPEPFGRTAAADIRWRRPFQGEGGEALRLFGTHRNGALETRRTGVDISRPSGSAVTAPADGVVRYRGHQNGYGVIMIIDHGADYATVLGPFDADLPGVAVGEIVLRDDALGRIGAPVEGNRPYLHIELRIHNKAVDPERLIR